MRKPRGKVRKPLSVKPIEKAIGIKAPADNDYTIVQGGLICPTCHEAVISLHRHDFVRCGCGEIFVDGGFDYMRAGGKDLDAIKHIKVRISKECLRYKPRA